MSLVGSEMCLRYRSMMITDFGIIMAIIDWWQMCAQIAGSQGTGRQNAPTHPIRVRSPQATRVARRGVENQRETQKDKAP